MSEQEPSTVDPTSRILDWLNRSTFPRRASCPAVEDAFLTVLSRIPEAHLNAFLDSSPVVISLGTMCVATMVWDDDPFLPSHSPDRHIPIIIVNTFLWPDQDALVHAVALQVACLISGRFENAGTLLAQDQVSRLLRTWGFSVFDSIQARDCRLRIELVDERPGMLVTGLQPYGDDDVEAFRPEWPS
jgi:hypothetical protein